MTDTELLDWLSEYCDQAVYNRPTPQYRAGWVLYCDEMKVTGQTLREVARKAKARMDKENMDE